ncbi:MAG: energy-coupling factor transporter transmembrane component T [Fretibacterium sp.]|nr:energy-coupling factor transporter transmembrane component T [Fretibacterium sp.]
MRFDADGFSAEATSTRLDVFDPRARVLCALALAVVLASLRSFPPLLCGSLIPLILLFRDEGGMLRGVLPRLNVVGIFVALILMLTYPGERFWRVFSVEGLKLALLVVFKLNVISILLIRMVVALGVERIENVLARFGLSEKLRVLLLLTTRCIFLLAERTETMVRAVHLRAPELRGTLMFKAFACMLGTTLLHSSDRAERTMLAIRCRGGLAGFSQCRPLCWSRIDTLLCLSFCLNIAVILWCCLLWRP